LISAGFQWTGSTPLDSNKLSVRNVQVSLSGVSPPLPAQYRVDHHIKKHHSKKPSFVSSVSVHMQVFLRGVSLSCDTPLPVQYRMHRRSKNPVYVSIHVQIWQNVICVAQTRVDRHSKKPVYVSTRRQISRNAICDAQARVDRHSKKHHSKRCICIGCVNTYAGLFECRFSTLACAMQGGSLRWRFAMLPLKETPSEEIFAMTPLTGTCLCIENCHCCIDKGGGDGHVLVVVCVCVYVSVCICIYICTYMYTYMCMYKYVYIHIHVYIYVYVCIYIYVYVYIYIHISIDRYICIYHIIHIYILHT